MKILHLFANWKWTGPAEPALNVAASQAAAGHDVTMAVGDPGDHEAHFQSQVVKRGVELLSGMHLDKHIRFWENHKDIKFLKKHLLENPPQVIHTHTTNDHLIGGRAKLKSGLAIPIIRSSYEASGPPTGLRSRYLLSKCTDALVVASSGARAGVMANFTFPESKLSIIESAIDTERFDPTREVPDKRKQYNIADDEIVLGIVARVQAKRRYQILLEAIQMVKAEHPKLKVLVIGSGTKINEVGVIPAKEMGLGETIIFTGVQRFDDYVGLLKAIDINLFLVPGSDGTCRAVREAMSMGLPVITARRGMLPEIVEDGRTGLVIEDTPGNLAQAILDLAKNKEKRERMGRTGADVARRRFALSQLGPSYVRLYESLLR